LHRLLSGLDHRRIQPIIGVIGKNGLADEFRRDGIPVRCLDIYRVFARSGLRGVRQIVSLIRQERIDMVVSYHTAADLLSPVAGLIARVPVLSSRRDMGFTKKPFHVRIQRHLNSLVRGIISVSHAVAREVHRTEGYPLECCQVIWNGEDLKKFRPGRAPAIRQELGISSGRCVISSVGGLVDIKDHATLIKGFGVAARECPDAHLLIIGAGPEEQALRRLAAPQGNRVQILGHRRDIPELLRASDIYAQTSLSEGYSNAILQAMATSLPVVVTPVGGNPELVNRDVGMTVETRNVDQVARALRELISNRETRREMGRMGRRWAELHGTMDTMVGAYTDAFERALNNRFPGCSSRELTDHETPWTDNVHQLQVLAG
jgi:glycosyltransferase involved in cell wall biosynthesis